MSRGDRPCVSSRSAALTIVASGSEVRRASKWLLDTCRQHDVPQALVDRLELCLNEVLANVIAHGGRAALSAPIRLLLEISLSPCCNQAFVTVSDAGTAFDPRSAPDRAVPERLADAAPNGMGLMMIRRFADWLDYRHEDGHNHFTVGTRWAFDETSRS